jgi:VIT1/CCC1 family predicted Fe2+/Mn2+ transporter
VSPRSADASTVNRYLANLRDERGGAALYRVISEVETDPRLAEVYRRMAQAEERHAGFWETKLRGMGVELPPFRPDWRTRVLVFLARQFGPGAVLSTVSARETIDMHKYDRQSEAAAAGLPGQERSHARLLEAITSGTGRGLEGRQIALVEGRHRAVGGNALRAAVLGANDGLLSNFSLVMGVAGASVSSHNVLVTGIAGLLAGAFSMALGEWLSVQSARELYERQIAVEQAELEAVPDEEAEELALIYLAKGLPEDEAKELAQRLVEHPTRALDTLAREELGIDPDDLGGSPWGAAAASFFLFAFGAIIPVAPFFALSDAAAVTASSALSAVGLFVIGAGITLMTGRSVLFSGTRQVLIGLAAAAVTFGLGRLIGAAL